MEPTLSVRAGVLPRRAPSLQRDLATPLERARLGTCFKLLGKAHSFFGFTRQCGGIEGLWMVLEVVQSLGWFQQAPGSM